MLGNLLTSVTLAQPSDQDQQAIMQGLFPDLACLLPCAMCMLHLVRRAAGQLPPHHLATEYAVLGSTSAQLLTPI